MSAHSAETERVAAHLAVQRIGAWVTPQLRKVLKAPPPVLPPSSVELLILVFAGLQILQVFLQASTSPYALGRQR